MNSYFIKLADKSAGTWAVEDRGPVGTSQASVIRSYITKKVHIQCPSYTFTQMPHCHYLVTNGKVLSFTPDEMVIG